MKKMKFAATVLTVILCSCAMIESVKASWTTSDTQHRHYIPKTISSTPSDTIKSENVLMVAFQVNKINNGKDKESNYKRIKIKCNSSSADSSWEPNGFTADSGRGTKNIIFTAFKGTYYEIATGIMNDTSITNCSFYYYGNDPTLDAYAYMWEDWS